MNGIDNAGISGIITDEELEKNGVSYERNETYQRTLQSIVSRLSSNVRRHITATELSGLPGLRAGVSSARPSRLHEIKHINIINKRISSITEAAKICSLLRDPRYEIFSIIYANDSGIITGHTAWSSGYLGITKATNITNDEEVFSETGAFFQNIKNSLMRLKASQVWISHNHPTGDATPSTVDISTTDKYESELGDSFKGHIVVDTTQFAFIKNQETHIYDFDRANENFTPPEIEKQKSVFRGNLPEKFHGALDTVVTTTIYAVADGQFRIISYLYADHEKITDAADVVKIKDYMCIAGGNHVFVLTNNDEVFNKFVEIKNAVVNSANDIFLDIVNVQNNQIKQGYTSGNLRWQIEDSKNKPVLNLIQNENARQQFFSTNTQTNKSSSVPWGGEDDVNEQFNKELELFIQNKLPIGHVFNLGFPGEILRRAGFPAEQKITLAVSRITEKSQTDRHPFNPGDLKNLIHAINIPVAVFSYENKIKTKAQNIILDIQKDGKKYLTGIHFNQKHNGIAFSEMRGLFPKENHKWLNWINQGKLLFADIEKLQAVVSQQQTNSADVAYLDLKPIYSLLQNNSSGKFFFAGDLKEKLQAVVNSRQTNAADLAHQENRKTDFLDLEPDKNIQQTNQSVKPFFAKNAVFVPWGDDFPAVMHFIDIGNTMSKPWSILTQHPAYENAKKHESFQAAENLVRDFLKSEKQQTLLLALVKKHPDAIIVPINAIEKEGKNRIPLAFAKYISKATSLKLEDSIVQSTVAARTGNDIWYRFAHRPEFDGTVAKNAHYILVDDVFTTGGTFSCLRQFIEQNGGRVVHTAALCCGGHGDKIALTKQTRLDLEAKYSVNSLQDFLNDKEVNLYGGNHLCLTECEATAILHAPSLDTARNRIIAARRERVLSESVIPGHKTASQPSQNARILAKLTQDADKSLASKEFYQNSDSGFKECYYKSHLKYALEYKTFTPVIARAGLDKKLHVEFAKPDTVNAALNPYSKVDAAQITCAAAFGIVIEEKNKLQILNTLKECLPNLHSFTQAVIERQEQQRPAKKAGRNNYFER